MLACVTFIVAFALVRANPQSPPGSFYDSLIDVLLVVALLLLAAGLAGVHALQKGNYGRIGHAGFYTTVVAALVEIVAFVVRLFGSTALEFVELLGILGMMVGFVLYGAVTLQAKVLPRWCGAGFIVGLPVWVVLALIFGVNGALLGAMLFGLLWLGLGYVLRFQSGATVEQPSRVR
jgi:hypothetical protein